MKRTNTDTDLEVCWPTLIVITTQWAPEVTVITTAAQESRFFFYSVLSRLVDQHLGHE